MNPTTKVISQSLLREYYTLLTTLRLADERKVALRLRLIRMRAADLPVEPGPLTCRVETKDMFIYSIANLTAALGADGLARLNDQVRRPVRYLYVCMDPHFLAGERLAEDSELLYEPFDGPDTLSDLPG